MISSSSSSILRWSLLMFISAYSERESDCLRRIWICLIWSWYFSSRRRAFSSDTSRAFWFSPMAASSSSMTTTRASAFFTHSSARLSSSSIMARDRARLSYFISFSEAILRASLRLMSISSISTSLFIVFDSQCLHDFTMLSASLDMCASFITVVASFSTEMRDSSSRRRTRRFWAFTSSSLSLKSFSASSILRLPQVDVNLLDLDLVVHRLRLPVPARLHDVVRVLGHVRQLHHGRGKLLHRDARLLLEKKNPTVLGVHVLLLVLEVLLGLVHLGRGELELLHDLLHGGVELLHLLAHVSDHHLKLVALLVAVLRLFLMFADLLVQIIRLRLHRLHFLPDGVHGCWC